VGGGSWILRSNEGVASHLKDFQNDCYDGMESVVDLFVDERVTSGKIEEEFG